MQRNKIFHAIAAQTILGSELKNQLFSGQKWHNLCGLEEPTVSANWVLSKFIGVIDSTVSPFFR